MKIHKNDRSSKTCILAKEFCHPRLSALAQGLYTCIKSLKNLCKIKIQISSSETYSRTVKASFVA